jgi:beta-1,4-mannosyltransferase
MKILHLVYSDYYQPRLCAAIKGLGMDAETYGTWGISLPEHAEALMALKPDILHLHWPEALCGAPPTLTEAFVRQTDHALRRLRDHAALVYTMHNLEPHRRDQRESWQRIYQVFADHAGAVVHHSKSGMERALAQYRYRGTHHVIYHGLLLEGLDEGITPDEARDRLGWPRGKRILWVFGVLRPDKNVIQLVRWFRARNRPDEELRICGGRCPEDYLPKLLPEVEADPRITWKNELVSDEDAAWQARAADCLVCNYGDDHLTSGLPHVSQALGIPMIALASTYAMEVLGHAAIWVPPDRERFEALDEALAELTPDRAAEIKRLLTKQREAYRWSTLAPQYQILYKNML